MSTELTDATHHSTRYSFHFAHIFEHEAITNFLFDSQKESSGHSLALEKVKKSKERVIEARRVMKLKENVYIEDRLKHLTVRDSWDI